MTTALRIVTEDRPGVLAEVTRILADAGANITQIGVYPAPDGAAQVHVELEPDELVVSLTRDLERLAVVRAVQPAATGNEIYGKRIIVIGGGAQVGQVALGAISEADRHNIRGERISVDTIPLVGEAALAAAVRAVTRLPRVALVVLAGSLMGGAVAQAVRDVRARGIIVISLRMAGSVPAAADLVVTDPVQAGVMAVMCVADTAGFDILRQRDRAY